MGFTFLLSPRREVRSNVSDHFDVSCCLNFKKVHIILVPKKKHPTTEIDLCFYTANTSGISLEQVLDFWTAADAIPPCGFPTDLEVDFYTTVTGIKRLPSSHTCVPVLWLPRGVEEPLQLQEMLVQAITCCQGFGKI